MAQGEAGMRVSTAFWLALLVLALLVDPTTALAFAGVAIVITALGLVLERLFRRNDRRQ